MGTRNSLCTFFLQVLILMQKKVYHSDKLPTHTCNTHNLHTKTTPSFCHKKYALIRTKSLAIHITTKTHFLEVTVHTSHEIINNSERRTSNTHCLSLHKHYSYVHLLSLNQ
jgi:hypothetical protein